MVRLATSFVKFLNALVTGNDATDLSDLDAAELNDIDSYLVYNSDGRLRGRRHMEKFVCRQRL